MPDLMFQYGYNRRSFRSKQLDRKHISQQLQFINNIIKFKIYDFGFDEYIIHSHQISCSGLCHLIAAAINNGDQNIIKLCLDIIYGRHDIGKPSREIIKGMLLSDNQECWQAIEKLLLSAQ